MLMSRHPNGQNMLLLMLVTDTSSLRPRLLYRATLKLRSINALLMAHLRLSMALKNRGQAFNRA